MQGIPTSVSLFGAKSDTATTAACATTGLAHLGGGSTAADANVHGETLRNMAIARLIQMKLIQNINQALHMALVANTQMLSRRHSELLYEFAYQLTVQTSPANQWPPAAPPDTYEQLRVVTASEDMGKCLVRSQCNAACRSRYYVLCEGFGAIS